MNLPALLAQMRINFQAWTLEGILIAVVVIAAAVGIVLVAIRVFGIEIPSWVVHIFWIVVVAFVAIVAIRLVFSF